MNFTSVFEDRRQLLALVHLISGVTLALFVVLHWLQSCCVMLQAVEALLAGVMMFTYWHIRQGAGLVYIENVLMASALLLFSALVFLESIENTGIYWLAGFPFVAYFVTQVKRARYWVGFFVLELFIAMALQGLGWVETPYMEMQLFQIAIIVVFFWVFAHLYQSQLELRQHQLEQSYKVLAQQQDRMQVILDHSPIGIWMVDRHRHIQFLNKAWAKTCGISEQQAQQAADYSDLLPAGMVEKALASDQACLESKRVFCARDEMVCADGVRRSFDFIKVRLSHDDGQVSGLVGFAIDVTEKLAAEVEQQSLEQQVQHAQRLESLGLMAGGIAHDFNNLLTVIQGNLELACLDESLSAPLKESLECMDSAVHAATDLCKQMLDYSGKGVMRPEPLNLQALIEEMLALLEVSKGKNIQLSWHGVEQQAWVLADRGQIRQVLLNLVLNASEAIGSEQQGEIRIAIVRRHYEGLQANHFSGAEMLAGDYVVLTVEDDGEGMSRDTKARIFDPFFTTKFTGRGLGMSAMLGILKAHHAGMQIESRLGEGTSMSVWLPEIDSAAHGHLMQPGEVQRSMSGRVLLVDDELGVLDVATRMLEHMGVSVAVAGNGRAALDIFSRDSDFDWVLLDVTMPEMGGVECLEGLRAIRPDIYVVMSSGYDAESALLPDNHCQPNDFITKPFTLKMLRAVVARVARSHD